MKFIDLCFTQAELV